MAGEGVVGDDRQHRRVEEVLELAGFAHAAVEAVEKRRQACRDQQRQDQRHQRIAFWFRRGGGGRRRCFFDYLGGVDLARLEQLQLLDFFVDGFAGAPRFFALQFEGADPAVDFGDGAPGADLLEGKGEGVGDFGGFVRAKKLPWLSFGLAGMAVMCPSSDLPLAGGLPMIAAARRATTSVLVSVSASVISTLALTPVMMLEVAPVGSTLTVARAS
jgi:hypothetical protein